MIRDDNKHCDSSYQDMYSDIPEDDEDCCDENEVEEETRHT